MFHFANNATLGYTSLYDGQLPSLYGVDTSGIVVDASHNLYFGVKPTGSCGTSGEICASPAYPNQPSTMTAPSQLDAWLMG